MTTHSTAFLTIEGLILDLLVGPPEGEGGQPQPIEIEALLFWPKVPLGSVSDELHDTIDYNKVIEIIKKASHKEHFHLIEHLAYGLHSALKKELPIYLDIMIRVKKFIPHLTKGVSFVYFPKKEQERKPTRDWDEE